MRIQKLHKTILWPFDCLNGEENCEKKANVFAKLIQLLGDWSLSLMREAPDHGRNSLQILKELYLSKGKLKIISLFTESSYATQVVKVLLIILELKMLHYSPTFWKEILIERKKVKLNHHKIQPIICEINLVQKSLTTDTPAGYKKYLNI